jgi:hypothetical protein
MTSVSYTAARRIALWSALTLVVPAALASLCWGQLAPQCVGPNKEPHSYGNFDFETNSRVDIMTYLQFKSGIVSCVANNDPEYPVYVRWLLPGPKGWVPPKGRGILESVPRLIVNDTLLTNGVSLLQTI